MSAVRRADGAAVEAAEARRRGDAAAAREAEAARRLEMAREMENELRRRLDAANEQELLALYQTASLDDALAAARAACPVVAVTRSAKGSVVAAGGDVIVVTAAPVAHVVDTTGAGDLYAAGFLHGYATGRPLDQCGRLGSIAAAEVIGHMGPRPETSLKALAATQGL
jgi:sugar/nucleoside kinase (ribokinase family)